MVLLTLAASAAAQEVTRVVVLAFEASGGVQAYGTGLPTGLQRSLNVINGVYVPPVGDTLLVTRRLQDLDTLSADQVAAAFDAQAVVSGQVSEEGGAAVVRLGFSGPAHPDTSDVIVEGPSNDPAALLGQVAEAVIDTLGLTLAAQDRQELELVVAQTPSLASLESVSLASLRLQAPSRAELNAAAEVDRTSSWVLSEYALALAFSGDLENALEMSSRAVRYEPRDVEAYAVRGGVLRLSGDREGALQAFERVLSHNPAHAQALEGRASLSDPADAQAYLERALSANPRLISAYLELAELQREQSPQRALQTLRRGTDKVPESTSLHRAIMREALRTNDVSGAYGYLQQFLSANPDAPASVYALAGMLPQPDYQQQALALVQQGRERYPGSATLALAHAGILQAAGDDAQAEQVLAEAHQADPDNPDIANQLAVTMARQGKEDEARAVLEAVAELHGIGRFNLAQIYLETGQSRSAIDTLTPLVEASPNDPELLTLYGIALGRAGRYDDALMQLEQALSLDPNDQQARRAKELIEQNQRLTGGERIEFQADAGVVFEAGLAAIEAGDFAEAEREFRRALELQDAGLIAFYHGYTLQLQGQARDAINSYERAREDMPGSATVLNNLGFAYYQIGRFDRALQYLGEAVEADGNNVEAQLNLGLVNYALDRYAQAVGPLERALSLDPELASTQVSAQNGGLTLADLLEDARGRASQ